MFQLFVVFHKKIYDECYEAIPQDILDKYFTFVAVNPDIPKTYTKDKYKIINEWELPHYNPQFQQKGYNENSVIYHVKANGLHKQYIYVGFFQYDMVFNESIINTILTKINNQPSCFYLSVHNYEYCAKETWNEPPVMAYLTSHYEEFYGKSFSYSADDIYPLFNSYVIPVETYEKIMKWVSTLYSRIGAIVVQTHFGHIGGLFERVMAFAVGEEKLHLIHLDVKHDHTYKNNLSREDSQ